LQSSAHGELGMSSREMDMLIALLGLQPVMKEDLNPKLCHYLEELSSRLYKDYPTLYMVSSQDLTELLPSPYYHRLEACVYEIAYYIAGCIKGDFNANPPQLPKDAFNELERYIKCVVRLKEREQKEKAALKAISPPLSSAKTYLNEEEYGSFLNSLSDAIDANLNQTQIDKLYCPQLWLEYSQEYTRWLSIIQSRKEKAINQKKAQLEYKQYKDSITHLISKVKSRLTTESRPKFHYPKTVKSYQPDQWCELELPGDNEVKEWSKAKIGDIVPKQVSDFLKCECGHDVLVLPSAKYEMLGIPCLTWVFSIRLLVALNLQIAGEAVQRLFHGIIYRVQLQPEDLGYYYLGPVDYWSTQEGFSTSIALLVMLSEGKMEDDGIEVIAQDDAITTYEVKGYDETIEVHNLFRKFIMDITKGKSLSQGLLATGIVDEMTANLIENKVNAAPKKQNSTQANQGQSGDDNTDVFKVFEEMGYKKSEALQMVHAAHFLPGMTLEEKLQAALKRLAI